MKKLLLVVAMMVIVITTNQAQAEDRIWCEGIPNSSMNITWGILYVDIGYGTWDLCSIRSERNGIQKETCQIIQKALLLAESEGKRVQFTIDAPGMSCTDLVTDWGDVPNPFPYHMNFSK